MGYLHLSLFEITIWCFLKSACLKVWFYFDTSIHGKGNVTTYEYNAANKVTKRIDPGGRTGTNGNYTYTDSKVEKKYTYYADGSLETRTDRKGNKTAYKYDSHGRVLEQTTATDTITYTYDNNGNQLTMTDTTGTTTRTYDELNRVLTKTVPSIGTTTFVYDKISNIEPGCSIETSKDPRGNLTEKVYDKVVLETYTSQT